MTLSFDPSLDLTISRVIKAPRSVVWSAWTDPASFEQWWVPAPSKCKVLEMDLSPGGSFVTRISEDGGDFMPYLNACFLAVDKLERIVFTNSLVGGWRPAEQPFMTAIITLRDHPMGTDYAAHGCTRTTPIETGTTKWAFTTVGHGHGATRQSRRATVVTHRGRTLKSGVSLS